MVEKWRLSCPCGNYFTLVSLALYGEGQCMMMMVGMSEAAQLLSESGY